MRNEPDSGVVSEEDVRAMVRLIGEVVAMPGGHAEKRRRLMDGLCALIDADAWAWAMVQRFAADAVPIYAGFVHGGFTPERFARFLKAVEHPDIAKLNAAMTQEFRDRTWHITRRREQIDPEGFFPRSAAYRLWCEADIGPIILSVRPLDATSQTALGVYRRSDQPLFDERESRIVHIILSEVPWLHEQGWPEDRGVGVPRLSPRQRITLNLLLDGQSRGQIAAHLGLSEHTVSGYVKEIYRFFGVNSHAELMRKFFQGDGGDR